MRRNAFNLIKQMACVQQKNKCN